MCMCAFGIYQCNKHIHSASSPPTAVISLFNLVRLKLASSHAPCLSVLAGAALHNRHNQKG